MNKKKHIMAYRTIHYRGKEQIYSFEGSQRILAQPSCKGRLKACYNIGKRRR